MEASHLILGILDSFLLLAPGSELIWIQLSPYSNTNRVCFCNLFLFVSDSILVTEHRLVVGNWPLFSSSAADYEPITTHKNQLLQ